SYPLIPVFCRRAGRTRGFRIPRTPLAGRRRNRLAQFLYQRNAPSRGVAELSVRAHTLLRCAARYFRNGCRNTKSAPDRKRKSRIHSNATARLASSAGESSIRSASQGAFARGRSYFAARLIWYGTVWCRHVLEPARARTRFAAAHAG